LEQFAEIGNFPAGPDQRYRLSAPLPKGKSGQHVIYAVWQRSDSAEAFYSCSDVKFGDSGAAPAPTSWKEVDQVRAQQDLPAGTKVTLRVFNAQGGDAASYSVTLTAANASAQLWPAALARQVNGSSAIVKIGVLGGSGVIAPVDDSMGNRIYLSSAYPKYTTQIDTTLSSTGSTAEWREGVAYAVGQTVSYQGKRYKCLQATPPGPAPTGTRPARPRCGEWQARLAAPSLFAEPTGSAFFDAGSAELLPQTTSPPQDKRIKLSTKQCLPCL